MAQGLLSASVGLFATRDRPLSISTHTRKTWSHDTPFSERCLAQDDPFLHIPARSRAFTNHFLSQFYLHESLSTSLFPFGHFRRFLKSKYSTWRIRRDIQPKASGYAVTYESQGGLFPHVYLSASRIFKTFRFVGTIVLRM